MRNHAALPPPIPSSTKAAPRSVRRSWIPILLIAAVLAVFWPVVGHEFLNLDDPVNVLSNPDVNPPTWSGLARIWRQPYVRMYVPVTYSLWAAVARGAQIDVTDQGETGLNPYVFHVANLLIHIGGVLVVWAILKLLVRNPWAAAAGALLFGVHPLQVEPVAWITGMKDVLCGLLSLVAIWQYLLYAGPENARRRRVHYALATVAFVLAILAKPTAIVLPLIIALLDSFILRRTWRQTARALMPWLVLSAGAAVLTILLQPAAAVAGVPLWARPLVAADALGFYLYKLLFPAWLGLDYGRSPQWLLEHGWMHLMWLLPLGLAVVLYLLRKRYSLPIIAAGVFLLGLLPVLGLTQFDFQQISTVADRYVYLAMLGPALLLAAWLSSASSASSRTSSSPSPTKPGTPQEGTLWVASPTPLSSSPSPGTLGEGRGEGLRSPSLPTRLPFAICLVVLCLLGARSWLQTWSWRDSVALYNHALALNPKSWFAHRNLVGPLLRRDFPEALGHAQAAAALAPRDPMSHDVLAVVLAADDRYAEAIAEYQTSLDLQRDPLAAVLTRNQLAYALMKSGRLDAAIEQYQRILRMQPRYEDAQRGLAEALKLKRAQIQRPTTQK